MGKECEARDLAVKLEMPNLVWFTHGLFSAKQALMKFQKRADAEVLEELKETARTEKNELKQVWKDTLRCRETFVRRALDGLRHCLQRSLNLC